MDVQFSILFLDSQPNSNWLTSKTTLPSNACTGDKLVFLSSATVSPSSLVRRQWSSVPSPSVQASAVRLFRDGPMYHLGPVGRWCLVFTGKLPGGRGAMQLHGLYRRHSVYACRCACPSWGLELTSWGLECNWLLFWGPSSKTAALLMHIVKFFYIKKSSHKYSNWSAIHLDSPT